MCIKSTLCSKIKLSLVLSALVFLCAARVQAQDESDRNKLGLAQSLSNVKKYDEAAQILEQLHAKYPQDKDIALELARVWGGMQKVDQALALLHEFEKKYPDYKLLVFREALILEANKRFPEARKLYEELSDRDPENPEYKWKIAQLSAWVGDYDDSLDHYRAILASDPANREWKQGMADVLFWAHKYPEAVKAYEELKLVPDRDKERCVNLGEAYAAMGRFNDAEALYKKLAFLYPDDMEIQLGLSNVMDAAGDTRGAESELQWMLRKSPQDRKVMLRLASLQAARRKFKEALKICDIILASEPGNKDVLLLKARVLSWSRNYKESIRLYDVLIAQDAHDLTARREKARVLGWNHEYKRSIDEYRMSLRVSPEDAATKAEMLAKESYYKQYDMCAISQYKKWLLLENDNLDAMFDLAQIYSRQMRWRQAREMYTRILQVSPDFLDAKLALDKVDLYSRSVQAITGVERFDASSNSRQTDLRYWDTFTSARLPLQDELFLNVREDNFWHPRYTIKGFFRERGLIGAEYHRNPLFWASGNYAYSAYTGSLKNSNGFNADVHVRPIDPLLLSFAADRQDVLDNGQTVTMGLRKNDYQMRADLTPNKRVALGGDYAYSHFTDRNEKFDWGTDITSVLRYDPRSLSLTYRYEEYGFSRSKDYLFTPGSFHTNKLELTFRHFLNKETLFWGSNDTYYTLRYAVNYDVHRQRGNTYYADVHRDWNKRFSTHLEWSQTVYQHRSIYGDQRVTGYLTMSF